MSARDRLAAIVIAAAALLGAVWFLAVAPERDRAAKAGAQLAQAEAQRTTAVAQERAAILAKSSFSSNVAMIGRLQKAVPLGQDIPGLLAELEATAGQTGVEFRSITGAGSGGASGAAAPPPAPTGSGPAAGPASQANGAVAKSNTSPQAAGGTTAPGAAGSPPGGAPAPAGGAPARASAASFPAQSFSLTIGGDFLHVQHFIDAIHHWASVAGSAVQVNGRLLTIGSVTIKAGGGSSSAGSSQGASAPGGGGMEAAVTVVAYTLPPDQAIPSSLLSQLQPAAPTPVSAPAHATGPGASAPVPQAGLAAHAPTRRGGSRGAAHAGGPPTAAVGVPR